MTGAADGYANVDKPCNDAHGTARYRIERRGADCASRTEVEGGYLVLDKDYKELERQLKGLLQRLRRVIGKRLVLDGGRVLTAYHASGRQRRRLMRKASERDLRTVTYFDEA